MDDYQADIRFGEWLKKKREERGLTIEKVAQSVAMEISRLKALEVGYADKGVTRVEATRLSAVYGVPLEEFLTHAEQS